MNDDPAVKTLCYLITTPHVRVRVVPVSPCCSLRDGEYVVMLLARLDRMERTSILIGRNVKAVPVDGGRFAELVLKMNDDVIAFTNVERRSGNLSVVREGVGCNARTQRNSCGRRSEIYLDGARQRRNVAEDGRRDERNLRSSCAGVMCGWLLSRKGGGPCENGPAAQRDKGRGGCHRVHLQLRLRAQHNNGLHKACHDLIAGRQALGRKDDWILAIEPSQLRVKSRMSSSERSWPLEESLRCNSKEFSRIGRAIAVEYSRNASGFCPSKFIELRTHHSRPRQVLGVSVEGWCAIGVPVLEIELMRELVKYDVLPIGWVGSSGTGSIPCEHERAQTPRSVTKSILGTFLPDSAPNVSDFVGGIAGRINDDRRKLGVVIGFSMKQ